MALPYCLLHCLYLLQEENTLRLKEIRLAKGLSVPKLVELSGIPRRTIQDIEKNGTCKFDTAIKLADVLNVSLDDFAGRTWPK